MRKNALKARWLAGEKTVNGWLAIPSSYSAEVMAHAGWHSLSIDLQHGMVDYQAAIPMLQAISTTDVTPMARAPWREPGVIMKLLDAGCYGIICPMVNTKEQAEELVHIMRYPPIGGRSYGPVRASIYGGADYPENANDEVLAFAMIETAEALENLEAICATAHLDGVYVGPADLANSLGEKPGFDHQGGKAYDAILRIIETAKKAGKFAGIHCGSGAYVKHAWSLGFDFGTILSDARLMAAGAKAQLKELTDDAAGPGGFY